MLERKRWQDQVKRWRKSGLSQAEFCRRENLSLATFQYRKSALERKAPPAEFVEIGNSASERCIELVVGTVTVRLPVEISNERVVELCRCLS